MTYEETYLRALRDFDDHIYEKYTVPVFNKVAPLYDAYGRLVSQDPMAPIINRNHQESIGARFTINQDDPLGVRPIEINPYFYDAHGRREVMMKVTPPDPDEPWGMALIEIDPDYEEIFRRGVLTIGPYIPLITLPPSWTEDG